LRLISAATVMGVAHDCGDKGHSTVLYRLQGRRKSMKTMMKKCGVYATFAVVLLAMEVLVTGCSQPNSGLSGGYQPPAGKGSVRLNLGDTIRSIVPGTTIDSFTKFDIDFQAVSGGALSDNTHTGVLAVNVAGPYELTPGTYDIEIIGYIGTGEAAVGSVSAVVIAPNVTTSVGPIHLVAYDPLDTDVAHQGNGTFSWHIVNIVTDLTAATMSFTKIAGTSLGSTPIVNLLGTGRWDSSEVIPAGYYYVDFVLTAKGTTRYFRHILHIYKGQTSSFTYTFDNTYFTYAKAGLIVDYPVPVDEKPTLQWTADGSTYTPMTELDDVTVSITNVGGPDSIDIKVTNAFTTIEWYFNSTTPTATGDTLTVDTTVAPFKVQGHYQLTVVGLPASGAPSSIVVYINIVE